MFEELEAHDAASLLSIAGDFTLVIDASGIIREVVVGEDAASLGDIKSWVGRAWSDTVTSETRGKIKALLADALAGRVSKRRQVNHLTAGAADLPVLYTTVHTGTTSAIVAVGRDLRQISIVQQRLIEAQQAMERDYWRLRHIETRYRLLFQLASDAVLVLDAVTLRVLEANNAAAALFAEPAARLVGRVFPFGVDAPSAQLLADGVSTARTSGRSGDMTVAVAGSDRSYQASATCFRQESATLLLVRFVAEGGNGDGATEERHGAAHRVMTLLEHSPDGFVVTDMDGKILAANRAFLDIVELAAEGQAVGQPIDRWVGRPGADWPMFESMLKKHGSLRLVATTARGAHGTSTEIEVSAAASPHSEVPCIGFSIRDIGRRLAVGPQGARDLSRAVEELTGLVGRVSLRELVRDTIDLVERHFIEAALELTNDNRTSAAEVLGVSRQSLYTKLRRHSMPAPAGDGESQLS